MLAVMPWRADRESQERPHVVNTDGCARRVQRHDRPASADARGWEILGMMGDYPARSRGYLIGYTLACLALGAAVVWVVLTATAP